MYDRWRKLQKAFYSDKKKQFDISKASGDRKRHCLFFGGGGEENRATSPDLQKMRSLGEWLVACCPKPLLFHRQQQTDSAHFNRHRSGPGHL